MKDISIEQLKQIFVAIRSKKPGLQILSVIIIRLENGDSFEQIMEMLSLWKPGEVEFDHLIKIIQGQSD